MCFDQYVKGAKEAGQFNYSEWLPNGSNLVTLNGYKNGLNVI